MGDAFSVDRRFSSIGGMHVFGERWGKSLAMVLFWLLLSAVVMALQLPPEIQADRYLLDAERAIQEQDFQGAKTAMDRILELQGSMTWSSRRNFLSVTPRCWRGLSYTTKQVELVTQYLMLTGRDGEHYRDALELLSDAEAAKADAEAAAEAAGRPAGETRKFEGMEFVWVPAGRVSDGLGELRSGWRRGTRDEGADQPWVLAGQVRGDAGGVAGCHGIEPFGVLRLRAVSSGNGFLERCSGLHPELAWSSW